MTIAPFRALLVAFRLKPEPLGLLELLRLDLFSGGQGRAGGARVKDRALDRLGESGPLLERRDDDRRRFEDQPLRRPARLIGLHYFGTLKSIERASVADLMQVDGISAETARRIYEFFHDGAA